MALNIGGQRSSVFTPLLLETGPPITDITHMKILTYFQTLHNMQTDITVTYITYYTLYKTQTSRRKLRKQFNISQVFLVSVMINTHCKYIPYNNAYTNYFFIQLLVFSAKNISHPFCIVHDVHFSIVVRGKLGLD